MSKSPERKNVVRCGVDIPGFSRLNLYNVHVDNTNAAFVSDHCAVLTEIIRRPPFDPLLELRLD